MKLCSYCYQENFDWWNYQTILNQIETGQHNTNNIPYRFCCELCYNEGRDIVLKYKENTSECVKELND